MSGLFGMLLGGGWILAGWVGYQWGRGDAETDVLLRQLATRRNRCRTLAMTANVCRGCRADRIAGEASA